MISIVDRIEPRWQAVTFAVIVLTFQQGFFEAHYFVKLLCGSLGHARSTKGREVVIQGGPSGIRNAMRWGGVAEVAEVWACRQNLTEVG